MHFRRTRAMFCKIYAEFLVLFFYQVFLRIIFILISSIRFSDYSYPCYGSRVPELISIPTKIFSSVVVIQLCQKEVENHIEIPICTFIGQVRLIVSTSWERQTLSLCKITRVVSLLRSYRAILDIRGTYVVHIYVHILISTRYDFSMANKNQWYFNWTVNGWRFFDLYHYTRDGIYRGIEGNLSFEPVRVLCLLIGSVWETLKTLFVIAR